MFLIPLNQPESVALVIHALRVAGGEADCGTCPVRRVCMKQCLAIADSLDKMVQSGTLPGMESASPEEPPPEPPPVPGPGRFRVVK
ncbi:MULTISPECIES: hypothetical protein [Syntrophotalea]|jgi:hypothetical protein|uniref:Radical SAM additional 4Fe4S-binding SPASM domain-containing protein n=1 Tax=Syntrophotalea acetylenica TaxID=29542 RepID=A0A1L3GG21_SYNAC|nr:hypothetical protein [Syntrophotalea acetylenica]APG24799.1 hypothetical protein A7E75_07000 [Syntrophotalea acetylenica]APG42856.1 hypothetical protein A6070_00945 [Syntrophotalea acetylenica]MDY0263475.1 hypothetical protein [Syntrophotalea acetylenica]